MLDSAIMGQSMVVPVSAMSCRSMALVMWCRPVMTSGAYRPPKMAPNSTRNGPDMPAITTLPTAVPSVQPMGPTMKCAVMTPRSSEQNGTTIICTTDGVIFLKKRS